MSDYEKRNVDAIMELGRELEKRKCVPSSRDSGMMIVVCDSPKLTVTDYTKMYDFMGVEYNIRYKHTNCVVELGEKIVMFIKKSTHKSIVGSWLVKDYIIL